jgi:diguanylate cyclase (GGDEF)-like protein
MKSRAITAITAVVLVVLGSVAAYLAGLHLLSSAAALIVAVLLFVWVQPTHEQERAIGVSLPTLRISSLLLCLGGAVTCLGATDGADSPFTGVLFLPILLAALFYSFAGSVLMGTLVSAIFLLFGILEAGAWTVPANDVLIRMIVYTLVAVAAGSFAENMRRTADEAAARAREQEARASAEEARAEEKESFLDTSVMMESVYDLENTLNIAMIRLADLVPYDVCAVFLREGDSPYLQIARLTGLPGDSASVRTLPLEEVEAKWGVDINARHWSPVAEDADDLGTLAALDPSARGVIVAPLRTYESFYGLIYLSTHQQGGFTERHRKVVRDFAQYVVFPIQRVRLRAMATTDAMTGLDNYRSFRLRLADEVRRAYRYGHPLSLILLDIDYFKKVNDTYGHPAGDALLKQMGAILRKSLRGIDVAARYGGEEMAIICPETAPEDACTLAERIRATVEANCFVLSEESEVWITISLGVATLPVHAAGDAALIEQADKALYAAKTGGRNGVRVAQDVTIEAAVR